MLLAFGIAFLGGVTRTLGRMVNARLAQQVGTLHSTLANYVVGLLCSLTALGLSWNTAQVAPLWSGTIPVWAYWGGAVGVLFIVLSNWTTPKLSAYAMTLLIFGGQIATGLVLDSFLQHDLSLGKIVGAILVGVGLLLNLLLDEAAKRKQRAQRLVATTL